MQLLICFLMIFLPVLAAGDQAQEGPGHDYTAEGKRASAYLDEEWVPSSWPDENIAAHFAESPVALFSYLPYPNPHSHPMQFVGVGRKIDFRLETWERSGEVIDTFDFTEVAPGFYKFTCGRMLPSTAMVTVVLLWDEEERGRATVQEKVLVAVD